MNDAKYIGMDVHPATICVAVLDASGDPVMEAILETKTESILQFLQGLRGSLQVTFEEGTWAAWLHEALRTYTSGEYRFEGGQLKRSKKTLAIRGLNRN